MVSKTGQNPLIILLNVSQISSSKHLNIDNCQVLFKCVINIHAR